MVQTVAKISVSIPRPLAHAMRRQVGREGLSGFVTRAISHELERIQLAKFLDELEQVIGPPSKAELAKVRRAWPKR
ncbi:MAG TPA: hypothetical protein VHO25_10360 [Polyangiaceae bacterium]|nr:hypothetical protein [Polyangiaceae bacterium]